MKPTFAIISLALTALVDISVSKDAAQETVSKHGHLSVKGVNLVNKNGQKVQLKGMSLFWDVWMPQYYNSASVNGIHKLCHSNVVRAAISVENGGYLTAPQNSLNRLYAVIDAAIKADIYVIVDWHEENANNHRNSAIQFFNTVSKKYKGVPNVIYETFNEPTGQSWSNDLKPYHEAVIKTIRANDANSVIILGTPTWSQRVDQAAADPIKDQKNIMYTLHFYAGSHKQSLRDTATAALNKGLPIFVTEYGTVSADGNGSVDSNESHLWWKWLDQHGISYANWAISDKSEGASALKSGTTAAHVCQSNSLTTSGNLVVAQNKA